MRNSLFTSAYTWVRQHLLISLGIILLLALVIWGTKPAIFATTHTNLENCGSLFSHFGPPSEPGGSTTTAQAIQCFVQAHQKCQAASLSYGTIGVDTGSTTTYYTANNLGRCALSGTSSFSGMVRSGTTDFTCRTLQQQTNGLHLLSCSDFGDQLIPLTAP